MKFVLLFIWFGLFQHTAVPKPISYSSYEHKGMAVVELFTSEGCSSCPAAEAVLARLASVYPDKVYLLEFHVDYWNRLGWNDPFSSAAYTDRQQKYNRAPGADGVYTPQAVINGSNHFVGSNEAGIRKTVETSLKSASSAITISDKLTGKLVSIKYDCEIQNEAVLNIALVQRDAHTFVKAGENKGRTLAHTQVVRDFITVPAKPGSTTLHLPDGGDAKDFSLIAYLQNKKTYAVTGATNSHLIQ